MGSLVPNIYLEAYAEVPVKWCPVNKKNEKKCITLAKFQKPKILTFASIQSPLMDTTKNNQSQFWVKL